MIMFMALHSTPQRKPLLIAVVLSLLLLGIGVGLALA
jgi:hypothetical protein